VPPSRAALIIGLYGGLAGLAVLVGVLRGHPDIYRVGGSAPWKLALSPLVGVACGLAIVFLTRLCVHRFEWARRLHRSFRGLLGALHGGEIWILAFASSVGEELFFRGALLPWLGVWGQAVVFALLHVGPGVRYLPWTLAAFLVGLLFGGLVLGLGDLGAPIVAHFTINFLNLRYIVAVDLPAE
jgi:membrane protease YdiL (CAAX protease family)